MKRRDFLKLAAAGAVGATLPGCSEKFLNFLGSGDEKLWGFNVHPYGSSMEVQLKALSELNVRKIRITLGLGRDLASPYISAYPAEYLGIVGDFNLSGVNPASWPNLVRQTVGWSHGVSYFEILNEPDVFHTFDAAAYVRDYLRPAYEIIRELRPSIPVVAAAPAGTTGGRMYFYQMTDAGADDYCDFRAVHLYNNNPEIYLAGTDRPFMVTETGKNTPDKHLSWWVDTMPHIGKILDTEHLFFYVLLDRPRTGYGLIEQSFDPEGGVRPTGPLYDHIRDSY